MSATVRLKARSEKETCIAWIKYAKALVASALNHANTVKSLRRRSFSRYQLDWLLRCGFLSVPREPDPSLSDSVRPDPLSGIGRFLILEPRVGSGYKVGINRNLNRPDL